jgi:hypothetical protein
VSDLVLGDLGDEEPTEVVGDAEHSLGEEDGGSSSTDQRKHVVKGRKEKTDVSGKKTSAVADEEDDFDDILSELADGKKDSDDGAVPVMSRVKQKPVVAGEEQNDSDHPVWLQPTAVGEEDEDGAATDKDDEHGSVGPRVAVKRKRGAPAEESKRTAGDSLLTSVEGDEDKSVTSSKPTAAVKEKPKGMEVDTVTVPAEEEEEEEDLHEPPKQVGSGDYADDFTNGSAEEDRNSGKVAAGQELHSDDIRVLLGSSEEQARKQSTKDTAANRAGDLEGPQSHPSKRSNAEVDENFVEDDSDDPIDATPDSVEEDGTKGQPTFAKKQGPADANHDGKAKVEKEPTDVDIVDDFEASVPMEEEDGPPRPKGREFRPPSTQEEVETFLEEKCTASKDWRKAIIAVAERLRRHESSDDFDT